MADTKISALAAKATPASADLLALVDVTDTSMAPSGTNKQATVAQVAAAVSTALGLGSAAVHPAGDFAGSLAPTGVKTSAYAANPGEFVPVDATSAGVTVTLPSAPADRSVVAVKLVATGSGHVVAVACSGSDAFNKVGGSTSATLSLANQGAAFQYQSSAGIWYVVGDDLPLSQLDGRYSTPTAVASSIAALSLGTASTHAATDFQAAGSYGTVSSVGLTVPGVLFAVAGSPVTTSGILAFSLLAQAANAVFAGPTTGANASPTMRALVAADIPALPYAPTAGSTSIVTLGTVATGTWQGTAVAAAYLGAHVHSGSDITTGTVAAARLPAMVASGASHAAGLVPDPGATAGTTRFLREDATWQVVAGGGSIASTSSILKGDGAGAAVAATAGTDYPGLASANTFSANQAVKGSSGNVNGTAILTVTSRLSDNRPCLIVKDNANNYMIGLDIGSPSGTTTPNTDGCFLGSAEWRGTAGYLLRWTSSSTNYASTPDTGLARPAAGVVQFNDGASGPGGLSSAANTPAQLSASANNYSPGVGLWQRWNASTPVNVTGMVAGQAGERRTIANVGSSTITLTNQDAASTAANRWLTTTGADIALAANRMVWAIYDATTAAWRVSLLP